MIVKYVDDHLRCNTLCMETAPYANGVRNKHAVACQNSFRRITRKAVKRGMKVNSGRTTLLCISGAQSDKASAHIIDSDGS